jgi:hypothetical protein
MAECVITHGSFLRGKRWCRKLRLEVALVILRRMVIRLVIILLEIGLVYSLLLEVLQL